MQISKWFTHVQPFLLPYHYLFTQLLLPKSVKPIPFPAFVSSFDAVPLSGILICVPACLCAPVLLWACEHGPFKNWLLSCDADRNNQEDYYLGSSICHCFSMLLCHCGDELLSHSLARFKSRHRWVGFLHIDALCENIFFFSFGSLFNRSSIQLCEHWLLVLF